MTGLNFDSIPMAFKKEEIKKMAFVSITNRIHVSQLHNDELFK
jgi:hypothetical protein